MDVASPEWNALPPAEKAQSLYALGNQEAARGEHELANSYFIQSLHLYRGLGDKRGAARALVALACLVGWVPGEGGFERVIPLAEEALALFREAGDRPGAAHALRLLSTLAPEEKAEAMLRESLALCEAAGDKPGIAASLRHLGHRANLAGHPAGAREMLRRSIALYRQTEDRAGLATALTAMALAVEINDRQRRACLEEALAIQRGLGDPGAMSRTLKMLSSLVYEDSNDPRNEPYVTEALAIHRAQGDLMGQASCLRKLAGIARRRGDTARAEALEAESKATFTMPAPDPELTAAFERGDHDAARKRLHALFSSGEEEDGQERG